ncbi:MAG: histidinol dehydrogenase [Phycisphaerales bacterium]
MIIPSIDLAQGRAVQLEQGRDLRIDAGDPDPIAARFARVGPIAVVDLDAALGRGDNRAVMESLVDRFPCRVGGGIRTREDVVRWLDRGADAVVVGTAADPELFRGLPRERLVAALDARDGQVMVEGWRTGTGRGVIDRMDELRPYVGGFLVTTIEREGCLVGADLEAAADLRRAAGDARLVMAGGVAGPEDVAALDRQGIDAQVGMAIYAGRMRLAEAVAATIRGASDGRWPTVVVDEHGVALGLAWSTPESLDAAIESGRGIYYSRSRGELWEKGRTSGATQELLRVDLDCDRDALRFTVRQAGIGFCHRSTRTCWGPDIGAGRMMRRVADRARDAPAGSYTDRLLDDVGLLESKLVEEAGELAAAVREQSTQRVAEEAADVLYFTATALAARGVTMAAVDAELDRRERRVTRRGGAAKTEVDRRTENRGLPVASRPERDASDALERTSADDFLASLNRSPRQPVDAVTLNAAREIVDDVQRRGMNAVVEHAVRLGDRQPGEPLIIERAGLEDAARALPSETRSLLERTAGRIRRFAEAQVAAIRPVDVPIPGGAAGHRVAPVDGAGCYAPGGRFPLPSSMLMTVCTARAAGVTQVWAASPRPAPITLAAAAIAGADGVLAAGGAHAIAALAYGAGALPAADVICGPGNRWVTAAKQLINGPRRIDMLAGPSELLLVLDAHACPETAAADLLAQAEHDDDAVPTMLAEDATILDAVNRALARQLETLPTAASARAALANGRAILATGVDQIVAVCDAIAPEHLQLSRVDADEIAARVRHFGGLFIGAGAAEVLGDYGAGPNHTLPTGGTARHHAGLSVADFLRLQSWMRIDDPAAAEALADDARDLARLEGLEGHARAAERRGGAKRVSAPLPSRPVGAGGGQYTRRTQPALARPGANDVPSQRRP